MVESRNSWYEKVYDYFKNKDNFLILNIEEKGTDIGKKLLDFLKINNQNIKFPHVNKTTGSNKNSNNTIIKSFLEKYVVKEDWEGSSICRLNKLT